MTPTVKRIIIALACVLATTLVADAQLARWIIRPVNQAISRMSSSHFKAWNAEHCGVFNSDGKQVVPFMADSITDFVNDCAVVLRLEEDRWRLLSVLHIDGSLYPVREQVYVDENPFVATDRLLVTDKKRRDVFIDLEGKKLKDKVRRDELPSAQEEPELVFYTDGPIPFEVGDLYGYRMDSDVVMPAQFDEAYPFIQGYAVATDSTGRYGLLRLIDGEITCGQSEGSALITDYSLASVDLNVGLPEEFANDIVTVDCIDNKGNEVEEKSYLGGTERVVPFMLPGGKHKVNISACELLLYSTTITATPKPKPKPKPKPQPKPQKQGGNVTRVDVPVKKTVTKTERPKVESTVINGGNLQLLVGASSLRANAKDCASFTITVTNNGTDVVSSPLTVSGKGVVCSTHQVTVPAKSSRSVTATFTGITAREQRSVTVSTSQRSTTKTITVTPFFTEF
jgi:hypothetical protein